MRNALPTATLLAAFIVTACGGGEKAPAADSAAQTAAAPAAGPHLLEVKASEFKYDSPDTIPAGATTIRLVDMGKELHHVQLLKLTDGKTYEDLLKEMKGEPPRWAVPVGGPNSPIPNGTAVSEATVLLDAGTYAMLCVIPDATGKPHVASGMIKKLVVIPTDAPSAPPASDLSATLTDYAFAFPDSISAGKHVVKVEVSAAQPHEIFIAKLEEGKTPEDLAKWVDKMDGPPPGAPFGGTSALVQGVVNYVSIDLPPGNYGLFCFIPDAKDGKPHVAHGMLRKLKVG